MKILIINGSPRKGNTYACIRALENGAKNANDIEILDADRLHVSPCKGCGACECTKGCVAVDDSNTVVDRILNADLVVFASPIYWWGVTAQLKTVIDKCYCKAAFLKGKRIGLILCAGAPTDDEEYSLIRRQFELIAEYLDWKIAFFKAFYATEKDEIANDPKAIAEMEALGRSIV